METSDLNGPVIQALGELAGAAANLRAAKARFDTLIHLRDVLEAQEPLDRVDAPEVGPHAPQEIRG